MKIGGTVLSPRGEYVFCFRPIRSSSVLFTKSSLTAHKSLLEPIPTYTITIYSHTQNTETMDQQSAPTMDLHDMLDHPHTRGALIVIIGAILGVLLFVAIVCIAFKTLVAPCTYISTFCWTFCFDWYHPRKSHQPELDLEAQTGNFTTIALPPRRVVVDRQDQGLNGHYLARPRPPPPVHLHGNLWEGDYWGKTAKWKKVQTRPYRLGREWIVPNTGEPGPCGASAESVTTSEEPATVYYELDG